MKTILEMLLGHLFSPFVAQDGLLIAHDAVYLQNTNIIWGILANSNPKASKIQFELSSEPFLPSGFITSIF